MQPDSAHLTSGQLDAGGALLGPTPPRTPYEQVIHGIWAELLSDVLAGSEFGVHDDFFELGGHSLLAPRVVARIRRTLGVQVPVAEFFGCRTVASLAGLVTRSAASPSSTPVAIGPRRADAEPVLSFDQERLWFENQVLPELAYNVHGRYRLTGELDAGVLDASVRAILVRHEALRTRFPVVDGVPRQVVDDLADEWRLETHDLRPAGDLAERVAQAARLADEQARTVFDLGAGALFRCGLIRLGDTDFVLTVTAHHIVCDDWSAGLFMRELAVLYAAGGDAERAGLAPMPYQYRDLAVWQREWLTGDTLERAVAYWRDQLAGAPPDISLPVAHPRTSGRQSGDWVRERLTADETVALHAVCRAQGVTPFMVLLAGLATMLGRWSGQDDLVIGVPVAGRTHPGTDALIGCLLNTLPIRVDLSGSPSFAELLARVRQVSLDGYAHADAPLDVLVQELDVARDPRTTPLFQVILNVLSSAGAPQLPGLTAAPFAAEAGQPTKFDLALNVRETGQQLYVQLDFNPERHDRALMTALAGELVTLLCAVTADPARPLHEYALGAEPVAAEPCTALNVAAADRVVLVGPEGIRGRTTPARAFSALTGTLSPDADEPGSPAPQPLNAEQWHRSGWAAACFDLGAGDRLVALSHRPGMIRAAVASALVAGATLHTAPSFASDTGASTDAGAGVSDWLRDTAITAVFLSAPQLRALTGPLPALRFAAVDNTGLIAHDVDRLRTLAPGVRIVSAHRVATDGRPATLYPVPAEWDFTSAPLLVPLGTELSPGSVRLVRPSGHPAAVGEVGEVQVDGRPTGQLARRWPDGNLHSAAGLSDDAVDDPAAVVTTVRDLPGVADVVIVCDTAHVATDADSTLTTATARQYLLARLPAHLVPAKLLIARTIPRTAHGDYDRAALQSGADASDGAASLESVPPRTPYEDVIHDIWAEVLGVSTFGVHEDFFELGGHSLLAPRVAGRIRETLGVHLPLAEFFAVRTVAGLAAAVAAGTAGPAIPVRSPDADPVLSFDQQRLWFENQLLPGLAYNVHGRHRLTGELDIGAFAASVRAILVRHEALRTRFPVVDGRPVQVVDDLDASRTLDVRDLRSISDPALRFAQAVQLADEQAGTAFDLGADPLFRCQLVRLGDGDHVLSITAHHIVFDDWSAGLFIRELAALYAAGGDVEQAGLAPMPYQYRDLAVWQREWLTGDTLEQAVSYWRAQLDSAPPAIAFPVAHPRSTGREAGDWVRAQLTPGETADLHALCRAQGVTPFMVFMAGLATVLGRWSGQQDLVIGVPIAGRTHPGTDLLIGCLLNTLPLRIDLTGGPFADPSETGEPFGLTFAELLARVRQVSLDGYAHADAPLDVLVQQLGVARDPRQTPLFQVILNMLDNSGTPQLTGLTAAPIGVATPQPTKFDLVLNVHETPQQLFFQFDFNPERHDHDMLDVLLTELAMLLRGAIADPGRNLLDYDLNVPRPLEPAVAEQESPAWTARLGLSDQDRIAALSHERRLIVSADACAAAAGTSRLPQPEFTWGDDDTGGPGADRPEVSGWLREREVSVLFLSAPQLRALTGPLPALRLAVLSNDGDLVVHDIERLRQLAPACRIVTVFGIGPDGQPAAVHEIPDDWDAASAPLRVPLGVELPHAGSYLAHPAGQRAVIGDVAELHLDGEPSAQLVRRWHDGTLEYVAGRDDGRDLVHTVTALRDLAGVIDVLVTDELTQDATLAAYIATGGDSALTAGSIRQHLLTRLPDDLIPSHVQLLGVLPRTPDGDYDLDALPENLDADDAFAYLAPRTPLEQELCEIFQQLLKVERVGVHDSFFDLNGFSLLATQLTSRVRETFGVELPLREVFTAPTVEGMAQLILWKQSERPDQALLEELLAGIEAE